MKLIICVLLLMVCISDSTKAPVKPVIHKYIVGGRTITIDKVPFQAKLQYNVASFLCGAVIIHPLWLLTAAHCIDVNKRIDFDVLTNSSTKTDGLINEINYTVLHPQFEKDTYKNDIALINLKIPITLNKNQNIIKLATKEPAVSEIVTITGYGKVQESRDYGSRTLQMASVSVMDKEKCKNRYNRLNPPQAIYDSFFCAMGRKTDACNGDSGGPAFINDTLVGLIAFGFKCRDNYYPGVYIRIDYYLDWITNVTNIDFRI